MGRHVCQTGCGCRASVRRKMRAAGLLGVQQWCLEHAIPVAMKRKKGEHRCAVCDAA